MTASDSAADRKPSSPGLPLAILLIGALTVVRYIGLHYSRVDLFFDESQYWAWSRELALGYFSKPPLLAWIIAATSAVCGDTEACVRAASPLFYFATSLLVYAIADALYDRRVAFWSALAVALMPGVVFSARIISTDVPLLFCWALALLAIVKLRAAPRWRWALVFGAALGCGLLAKYAMAYVLAGLLLAALIDRPTRALFARPQIWAGLLIGALILLPNIVWNLNNGLVTLRHTGDNIQGAGFHLSVVSALEFLASQFGVAGPLVFGGFLLALPRMRRLRENDRLLIAFAIPPLAIITAQALLRGANANWAAAAFVSAGIVVVALWVRQERFRLIAATLAIGVMVQALLLVGDIVPYRVGLAALGPKGDAYRRTLGWRELGETVRAKADAAGAKTVAAENRHELASLVYYLRDAPQPVRSWPVGDVPDNQFDMTHALTETAGEPILFVTFCGLETRLGKQFASVRPLGVFTVRTGPFSSRTYGTFLLSGSRGPVAPLGRCEG